MAKARQARLWSGTMHKNQAKGAVKAAAGKVQFHPQYKKATLPIACKFVGTLASSSLAVLVLLAVSGCGNTRASVSDGGHADVDSSSSTSASNLPRATSLPSESKTMEANSKMMKVGASTPGAESVEAVIAKWRERPRLGATQMIAKYGPPQDVTAEQLVWRNPGPFKRITVMNLETPHDFPLPHVDFLEHTIAYDVPQDKVGDLVEFDASSTINRTVGELSARCDLEGHNILTLNLDHDIVTGKKTVQEARTAFGEIVAQDVMGKHPAYVESLQFETASKGEAAFADVPVIPGSPMRAAVAGKASDRASSSATDGEILATCIAVDLNEVLAAAHAQTEKISQPVKSYAKMLHEAHGANMVKGMKLGEQNGITPLITAKVEKIQVKGAGELAALVPLDGSAFEKAYLAAMVKGHTEVLAMIDGDLMKAATNDVLKQHLTASRAHVADHLEKAKSLQKAPTQ